MKIPEYIPPFASFFIYIPFFSEGLWCCQGRKEHRTVEMINLSIYISASCCVPSQLPSQLSVQNDRLLLAPAFPPQQPVMWWQATTLHIKLLVGAYFTSLPQTVLPSPRPYGRPFCNKFNDYCHFQTVFKSTPKKSHNAILTYLFVTEHQETINNTLASMQRPSISWIMWNAP